MSLSRRYRRVADPGNSQILYSHGYQNLTIEVLFLRPLTPQICSTCRNALQIRHASFLDRLFLRGKSKEKQSTAILDPLSPDFLKRKPPTPQEAPKLGKLAPGSILEDADDPAPGTIDTTSRTTTTGGVKRDPKVMAAVLDPLPHSRMRWERKMVIRSIRKRGRLSKTERLRQMERESLSKSAFFKTSVKKLFPLARQIAGKPIEEAIVQMRFSKKKVAQDVKKHLEYARDEAIVARGMGLGQVQQDENAAGEEDVGEEGKVPLKPRIVEDKEGRKRVVVDPTQMYVDQAWVGRGAYTTSPSFRARGKVDILRHPTTSEWSDEHLHSSKLGRWIRVSCLQALQVLPFSSRKKQLEYV